jgi:hypothetical protein
MGIALTTVLAPPGLSISIDIGIHREQVVTVDGLSVYSHEESK